MKRIAFFLSNKSCPHRCIYCDQRAITGEMHIPSPREVAGILQRFDQPVELCFFGGSFTCFKLEDQRCYLDTIKNAPQGSKVRFSTHPLCINEEVLDLMNYYPISMIELGVSSLNNEVLAFCGRGYDNQEVIQAMRMVISRGFALGAQLMIGLPFQNEESSLEDVDKISEISGEHITTLRIYPCLVLRNTYLEELYKKGLYRPLGIEEAADWSGKTLYRALNKGLKVQRIGLQETESLSASVIAGPHHPALGEMAKSHSLAITLTSKIKQGPWQIGRNQISLIKGHNCYGLRVLSLMAGLAEEQTLQRIEFV